MRQVESLPFSVRGLGPCCSMRRTGGFSFPSGRCRGGFYFSRIMSFSAPRVCSCWHYIGGHPELHLLGQPPFSYLMFPGFWYAGKPGFGLGLGSIIAVIWKSFLASAVAGCATALVVRSMPHLGMSLGAPIALVRIVSISSVYFSLYVGSVIVLHRGLKPLHETVDLLRELLPDRKSKSAIPAGIDMDVVQPTAGWNSGSK